MNKDQKKFTHLWNQICSHDEKKESKSNQNKSILISMKLKRIPVIKRRNLCTF